MSAAATACPYCGVGCGVKASGKREALKIEGTRSHPANLGRLCSKGAALADTVKLDGRLLNPVIGDTPVNWAHATRRVAEGFLEAIRRYGPDSVAFYVSGQLLTEDYYIANKLMKGFIGSANIDTNSRLCMASAVVAHKLAFGEDVVPACYADLDLAELIVFSGHNAAWTHPVLYRRMETARERGQRHVVIDPRVTDTARGAHLHLKIRSQTDVRLWNGLLAHLDAQGALDRDFIAAHTSGWRALRAKLHADDQSISAVATDCGLTVSDVTAFFRIFAATSKTVTLFSQGANQSLDGVAKGLAIINAHLATGRIGKPGASPFSITGQPNAMGGRETGGMANTLAAHLEFTPADIDAARRFWRAPNIATQPGLKAVDMFDAVADGRIKAIWIMATNPAISMPNADRVRAALKACPFVVVSEAIADTDTARLAHVRLPALAWGEKDGAVTNSERRISRQRAFLAAPGQARGDWRIIRDVAHAMGFADRFAYHGPADIFREYAALTGFENEGQRALNISALSALDDGAYDALAPVQWPIGEDKKPVARLFGDGRFPTADGKAVFHLPAVAARAEDAALPLLLNTGRVRDQWHTMTRTGLAPRLMRHAPEPYLEISPADAAITAIADGALVEVQSPHGRAVFLAKVTADVRDGEVFAPMHWSGSFAPHASANALVSSDFDVRSGQPEFKRTPVSVTPAPIAWRAFLVSRSFVELPQALWWRRIPHESGQLYEIAAPPHDITPQSLSYSLFGATEAEELLSAADTADGFVRMAAIRGERLELAFFATRSRGLPARDWLLEKLAEKRLTNEDRRALLAGGAATSAARGQSICACFDVTRQEIQACAASQRNCTVASISAALKAGTNCGSCRPEIASIIQSVQEPANAAA